MEQCLIFLILCSICILHCSTKPQQYDSYKRSFQIDCKLDSDCGRNAYCDRTNVARGNFCTCIEHFIQQTNKTSMDCLPTPKNLGDFCEKDIQCQVTFGSSAQCYNNECRCNAGSHLEEGVCYQNGKIGDSCNTNAECYIPDTLTFCVQSVCVCNKFYHAIENGQRCIKSKVLGETCESDTECTVKNSKCHGECRCNIHYVSSHDKTICLEASDHFNSTCQEDVQCTQFLKNAACLNGKCDCAADYHMLNGKCWENVQISGDCLSNEECILIPEMTDIVECSSEKCTCKYGVDHNWACSVPNLRNKGSKLNNHVPALVYLILACILYVQY